MRGIDLDLGAVIVELNKSLAMAETLIEMQTGAELSDDDPKRSAVGLLTVRGLQLIHDNLGAVIKSLKAKQKKRGEEK